MFDVFPDNRGRATQACPACVKDGHSTRKCAVSKSLTTENKKRKVADKSAAACDAKSAKLSAKIGDLQSDKKKLTRKVGALSAKNKKILLEMDAIIKLSEPAEDDEDKEEFSLVSWMRYGLEMIMKENGDGKPTEANLLMQEQYVAQSRHMGELNK
jgi:seryl-tRNA synthetase